MLGRKELPKRGKQSFLFASRGRRFIKTAADDVTQASQHWS